MSAIPRTRPGRGALTLALLAAGGAACGPVSEPARSGPRPPHVLFVTIDTLRADHLGLYGYDRPTSPALDAFAETATVFDAAQSSSSWTLPSLASALTGHYTSTHRCWGFSSRLDDSFTTLTEVLLAGGYDTACVTSHVFTTTRHGLQQGFVHFDDSFAYPAVPAEKAVTSGEISDRGLAFLEQKAAVRDRQGEDEPWFLWLHYFDPHDEYVRHAGVTELFEDPPPANELEVARALYDGEIRFTDGHVGRVFAALERLGFADDTVVVVLSDHGEEFGDHGQRGHGHTLFRELVRVPFLIRAPGTDPGRVASAVRTVDLMPTVLDLVGLRGPGDLPGVSLAGLMRGRSDGRDLPALAELDQWDRNALESLQEGRWKYMRRQLEGDAWEERLYDLEADPGEARDVAADHPDVAAQLRQKLERMRRAARKLGEEYGRAGDLQLSGGETGSIEGLGYVGGDD